MSLDREKDPMSRGKGLLTKDSSGRRHGVTGDIVTPPSYRSFNGEEYELSYCYPTSIQAREAGKNAKRDGRIRRFRVERYGMGYCLYILR